MNLTFDITYKEENIQVKKQEVMGQTIYHTSISGNPIFITKARALDGTIFWNSVPEGQLQLASELGTLINQL